MRQDAAGDAEELLQRLGSRVHRDPHPAAPGIQLELRQRSAFGVGRALPVLLVEDVSVLALEVVSPAVERADKVAAVARHAVHAIGGIDQLPATMRADVVVGAQGVTARTLGHPHHDDRFIAHVVGEEIAEFGNDFEPFGHLPHAGPQPFLFRLGVFAREERLGAISERLRQVLDREARGDAVRLVHRASPLSPATRARRDRPHRAMRSPFRGTVSSPDPSHGTAPNRGCSHLRC